MLTPRVALAAGGDFRFDLHGTYEDMEYAGSVCDETEPVAEDDTAQEPLSSKGGRTVGQPLGNADLQSPQVGSAADAAVFFAFPVAG